jgi:dUTP pyrophosphatase
MSNITNTTSPPTSPLPKRQKTDHDQQTASIDSMASSAPTSNHTSVVTKVEQAPALLIKKLSDKAKLPTRGSEFAAGYDIYAAKETVIPARGKALVDTDISMAVPAGTCA